MTRAARRATTVPLVGAALVAAAALGLVAVAGESAHADVFSNVSPGAQPGLAGRYPLGRYALDHHFSAVKASVLGGVDVSGVPALIAYFLADVIWQLTAFMAGALIALFTFAFSLDLVNGSQATGGAGALEPVSRAVRSLYRSTFGEPWLVVAIVLAGLWAMWKALVQRRYVETAGALGLSVVFCVIALAFVIQPERTIGSASRLTNEMSVAFLSLTAGGDIAGGRRARSEAADRLFALLVHQPWTVLNFGGLEHCVRTPIKDSDPESVAVRPLSRDPSRDAQLARQLRSGTQVQADGKLCINNHNKYADRFLSHEPESDERDAQYEALSAGDTGKLPDADPAKEDGSYPLGAADKPAADAMKRGGQFQRLLMAVVILLGELGAFLLLGALAAGVILAQVLVLVLLAFAPVALVAGVFPGRGHDFFRGWLARLIAFLLRKAAYSLVLAVLLAVLEAVGSASANLGWLLSFGLQAAFLWAVFLYRHQLTGQLVTAAGGAAQTREPIDRLASAYWWRQVTAAPARALRHPLRAARSRREPTAARPSSLPAAAAPHDSPTHLPDIASASGSGARERTGAQDPAAGGAEPRGHAGPPSQGPTGTPAAAPQQPPAASPGRGGQEPGAPVAGAPAPTGRARRAGSETRASLASGGESDHDRGRAPLLDDLERDRRRLTAHRDRPPSRGEGSPGEHGGQVR